jgi:Family of unknown function (DUF5677)
MSKKKRVLGDHERVGKTFVPPVAKLGWNEIHYIERIIPEIVWIAYFVRSFGELRGCRMAVEFIETCYLLKKAEKHPGFSFVSNYRSLSADDWTGVLKKLQEEKVLDDCRRALGPFIRCYSTSNPFKNLFATGFDGPASEDIELSREVVSHLFDRRSKSASVAQSVVLYADVDTGKLKYIANVPLPDLNSIFGDFESEASTRACAHVRMHVNAAYGQYEAEIGDGWARYFWNRGRELVPLKADIRLPHVDPKYGTHPVLKFGIDYELYAWALVDEIWAKLPVDIYESEFFEVIGALLARQCNLAVKIALNSCLWDYHASPLFLRPMTDCYITAAWIFRDPLERARKFISYGLGQEKLHIEHLRSTLDECDPADRQRLKRLIEAREGWVNSQHFAFLQHVDVGSWSGISTRQMAEEADCMSLYTFAYTPWSFAAHGMWNHIGRFDATPGPEPLHKHMWQPTNFEHGRQTDVVVNATKYFDKLCTLAVERFELKMSVEPPNSWLRMRLGKLYKEMPSEEVGTDADPTK